MPPPVVVVDQAWLGVAGGQDVVHKVGCFVGGGVPKLAECVPELLDIVEFLVVVGAAAGVLPVCDEGFEVSEGGEGVGGLGGADEGCGGVQR